MTVLEIQHAVPDFDRWKRAFDADPMNRRESGVRRYQVYRRVDDPNLVTVVLEFDSESDARSMLGRLQQLWAGPGGSVMRSPEAWILDVVESHQI